MALISKPSHTVIELDPIGEILQEKGIIPAIKKADSVQEKARQLLEENGLGLEELSLDLKALSLSGKENVKLAANKLAWSIHGLGEKKNDVDKTPHVTLVIQGENTQILNILTPRSS